MHEVISKNSMLNDIKKLKEFLFLMQAIQTPILGDMLKAEMSKELEKDRLGSKKEGANKYEPLTDDRNLLWIDRIEDFHKNLNGNVLFAFGKAHLYSNQGIIKLLENRGYTITKLFANANKNDKKEQPLSKKMRKKNKKKKIVKKTSRPKLTI